MNRNRKIMLKEIRQRLYHAEKKRMLATATRLWIERTPYIHVLNYWYYRWFTKEFEVFLLDYYENKSKPKCDCNIEDRTFCKKHYEEMYPTEHKVFFSGDEKDSKQHIKTCKIKGCKTCIELKEFLKRCEDDEDKK